ncbi:MAG TPA: ATP-binding protein [Anaerolineales bacterium]
MTEQQFAGEEPEDEAIAEGSGDVIRISGNIVNSTIIVKSVVRDDQVVDLEKLPPEAGEPPYQGLQYFEERDAGRFFGREQLTTRVIGRLARTRFLSVIGASGSGKSSLVRAGVIPTLKSGARLADGSLPPSGSTHWSYRVFNPGGHPLDALAAALSKEDALPNRISSLRDELATSTKSLALAIQSLLALVKSPHLLLVVDQFEEIFTQARSSEEREAFINALISISSPEDTQPLSLLVCLRADFYAQVAQHDRLREMISQHQEFIGAMNRAELVDAIVAPLVQGNWKIQEGLVKVILDDVGYEPGALPLLSHALLETWKRRRGRTLTLSGYVESGGVDGAIRETAEAVFNQRLTREQRPIARMIFLRLAELNEDAQATRRRASFDELITRATDELTIQTIINILVDARLVTTSMIEPGTTKVVEVAHESLIREWPTLQKWLNEDRQGLILHRQVTEATEDWIENGRDPGLLIRGKRLAQVQEWASKESNADSLSLQEVEFLESSQANALEEAGKEARLARAQRTQRIFTAVIASLLVLVGILGYSRLQPPKMDRDYNVAVADIGEIEPDGRVRASANGRGAMISQTITAALQNTFQDDPNILIWNNSPELRLQRVRITTLESNSPEGLTQAAASLAKQLNADMIIYGIIDQRQQPPVLNLQMYLAPKFEDALDEIKGNFPLNSPIQIGSDLDTEIVQTEITRQANLLAKLVLAQSESKSGRTLEALEGYLEAAEFAPESDMLQFFIGRESLFVIEREAVPQNADEAFVQQARAALENALLLNPQNARAYIGLGSLYLKPAKSLILEAADSEYTDQSFQQIMQLLDQAEAAYRRVLQLEIDSVEYGVPVEDLARLGLGDVQVSRGIALQGYANADPGREEFQEAIQMFHQAEETVKATLTVFQVSGLSRYLALNHQVLGSAYQYSGYLADWAGDSSAARQAYRQAIEQFDACIALGENSTDRVVQVEIIEANCLPLRQTTEERLQALDGGS